MEGFSIGALPDALVQVIVAQLDNPKDLLQARLASRRLKDLATACIETLYTKKGCKLPSKAWLIFPRASGITAHRSSTADRDHYKDVMKLLRSLPSRVRRFVVTGFEDDTIVLDRQDSSALAAALRAASFRPTLNTLHLDMCIAASDADLIFACLPSLTCLQLWVYYDLHSNTDNNSGQRLWRPSPPSGLKHLTLCFHDYRRASSCQYKLDLGSICDTVSLQALDVNGSIHKPSLSLLPQLSQLSSLTINSDGCFYYDTMDPSWWDILSQLPKLQHAEVPNLRLPSHHAAITQLAQLTSLSTAALDSTPAAAITLSAAIPQLRALTCTFTNASSSLPALPRAANTGITSLHITHGTGTQTFWQLLALHRLPALRSLTWQVDYGHTEEEYRQSGITEPSVLMASIAGKCKNLRTLSLSVPERLELADMALLASGSATGLTELHLHAYEISLSAIMQLFKFNLAQLRKLRVVTNFANDDYQLLATEHCDLSEALDKRKATSDNHLLRMVKSLIATKELSQAIVTAAAAKLPQLPPRPRMSPSASWDSEIDEMIPAEEDMVEEVVSGLSRRWLTGRGGGQGAVVSEGEAAVLIDQLGQVMELRCQLMYLFGELLGNGFDLLEVQYSGVAIELVQGCESF